MLLRNIMQAGFAGTIYPVNPGHDEIAGLVCYHDVRDLPEPPDLVVICSPARTVPATLAAMAARGAGGAVIISAGFHGAADQQQAMRDAARAGQFRFIGPNCVGLLVPGIKLNASFAHLDALPGKLAFVSQSGGFCTAVLDWARPRGIGFSHFISLGDSLDVDIADVLAYLADDTATNAILVYLESVSDGGRFMAAARRAAIRKPVIMLKAGRMEAGARAAASHTGALAGADTVYDAALARAGILRVTEIEELFEAAETLERAHHPGGERLAILTNGGGPGVTAIDALAGMAGPEALAELSPQTREKLAPRLPQVATLANPLDIIGDADVARLSGALEILMDAPEIDAILVLYAPTAITPSQVAADAVVKVVNGHKANASVLTAWLGEQTAAPARSTLRHAGIPSFETPYSAVRAFWHLVQFRRNQQALAAAAEFPALQVDRPAAMAIIAGARAERRTLLTEPESKQLLAAWGIPVVTTRIARNAQDARQIADETGYPVAVKILSPDITHKTEIGGVALDLTGPDAVERAATEQAARLRQHKPDAILMGFTVQPMARRAGQLELLAGIATDPVFGPVVVFGEGGTEVELIRDRALDLAPLNRDLAGKLIDRTLIARRLRAWRGKPATNRGAIEDTLVALAHLASEIRDIQELDINPLLADPAGVIALDARVRLVDEGCHRTPCAITRDVEPHQNPPTR